MCEGKRIAPSQSGRLKAFEDESRVIWDSQEVLDYYPENQKVSITHGKILLLGILVFDKLHLLILKL